MEFSHTQAHQELRAQVKGFLQHELTDEVREEVDGGQEVGEAWWGFLRRLGERGWVVPTLPPQYGGLGASHLEHFIIAEELGYAGAPGMEVTAGGPQCLIAGNMVAPALLRFGTPEQRQQYLPPIARGETEFAIGFTEPHAGSDLASLEIRAAPSGPDYILSGEKMFSTAAHYSHYHWLAARTDPEAPRHRGISLFVVDLRSPGITIRPIWTMSGLRTNQVFYDEVRVPGENLVGELGRGFYHIATTLDYERMYTVSGLRRTLEMVIECVAGGALGPGVRHRLSKLSVRLEVARLFSYRLAWVLDKGLVPSYEASMLKVLAAGMAQGIAHIGLQALGLAGQLRADSGWAPLRGRLEHLYRHSVFASIGGGTSEVQRNIVAIRGLGLPRA
ncbi:MAG: acyl-CoA dehydrogenase family protein [Dehalococcoidia bacterium]